MIIKKIFCHSTAVLMIIVILAVTALVFLRMRRGAPSSTDVVSTASTSVDAVNDDLQKFSGDGYALSVPADWSIEQMASSAIAIHGNSGCVADLFRFPFPTGTDMNVWISAHISADPSLLVMKDSAESIPLAGGTGIRWKGVIDGVSTTIIYAFNDARAYEISLSTNDCGDALDVITAHLILQ